jgi:hypothetical protein
MILILIYKTIKLLINLSSYINKITDVIKKMVLFLKLPQFLTQLNQIRLSLQIACSSNFSQQLCSKERSVIDRSILLQLLQLHQLHKLENYHKTKINQIMLMLFYSINNYILELMEQINQQLFLKIFSNCKR